MVVAYSLEVFDVLKMFLKLQNLKIKKYSCHIIGRNDAVLKGNHYYYLSGTGPGGIRHIHTSLSSE